MKSSKLIEKIQNMIDMYGDMDVVLNKQTGPDSWEVTPVKTVEVVGPMQVGSLKKSAAMVIE